MTQPTGVDVKAFIDQRGLSSMQWLLLVLCFFVVAVDGMDVAIMGFLAPSILQEWHASRASFGAVMSAAPIGLVIGALVAGPASDRFGRKTVLTTSVALFGLFTIGTAYTQDLTQMAALRLLTGLGLGAAMPNSTTLLSEYVPQRSRSLLIATMFTGFNLGSGTVGFVAAWLIPQYGWRSVLLVGGALPLLMVPLLLVLLPESARFMVIRRQAAARIGAVLGRICGASFPPGTEFHARVHAQLGRQRNWKDTGDLAMLFQGAYSTALYRKVRDILHAEVETGGRDDDAWTRLEEEACLHRSPHPFRLSLGA